MKSKNILSFQKNLGLIFKIKTKIFPVIILLLTTLSLLISSISNAESLNIAVAANFILPFKEIASKFENETDIKVDGTFTSTGNLYSQIRNGAPYDLFLAADRTWRRAGQSLPGLRGRLAIRPPAVSPAPAAAPGHSAAGRHPMPEVAGKESAEDGRRRSLPAARPGLAERLPEAWRGGGA